MSIPAEKFFW
jgi:hypothetical protein